MQEQMFANKDPEERLQMLSDSCDKVEEFSYEKEFTNQDVEQFQAELSEVSIKISQIEQELAKVKKVFTEKMKPLKTEFRTILENIQYRARMVKENAYVFVDHTNNKVGYYNSEGKLIHRRLLNINEHQKTIMSATRVEVEDEDAGEGWTVDQEAEEVA